jgi:transcription-repair coupling factor (superfamily II helicase)
MEIYQKLAAIKNEADIEELSDELIDRFGDPPLPVLNLLAVVRVKNLARALKISLIIEKNDCLEIVFADEPDISPAALAKISNIFQSRISFSPGLPRTVRILNSPSAAMPLDAIFQFLSLFSTTDQIL